MLIEFAFEVRLIRLKLSWFNEMQVSRGEQKVKSRVQSETERRLINECIERKQGTACPIVISHDPTSSRPCSNKIQGAAATSRRAAKQDFDLVSHRTILTYIARLHYSASDKS